MFYDIEKFFKNIKINERERKEGRNNDRKKGKKEEKLIKISYW